MPKKTTKKETSKQPEQLKPTTNATLDEHKQEILGKGRRFVRPLSLTRKRVVWISVSLAAALVIASLTVLGIFIYRYKSDGEFVYQAARIIPYPAGKVEGKFITYADFLFELRPLKHYYESPAAASSGSGEPINFSTPDGQRQLEQLRQIALNEAQKKVLIHNMAKEKDIKVSAQEINDEVNAAIQREGGEKKFAEAIDYFYGWDISDFRKVLQVQLLQRKLMPAVSTDERQLAEEVLEKARSGSDFGKLASKYSTDPGSKDKKGRLGSAGRGDYVKEFEDAAFELEPGQISGIVETQYGFHIIKLLNKKNERISAAHILINYKDLSTIYTEKLRNNNPANYLGIKQDFSQEPASGQAS